jgi:mono/diheme cytochrome c family protein
MRIPILIAAWVPLVCGASATQAATIPAGEAIFQGACATCHAAGSPRVVAGQPLLPDTRAITGDNPTSAIGIILHGHFPPPERRGPWMPSFAAALNDAQIADVLNWLRQSAGQARWPDLAQRVRAVRAKTSEAQQ